MFLKRKIDDGPLFTYETESRRASYRLQSVNGEPLFFDLAGKPYEVLNIGGGGLSFLNPGCSGAQGGPIELKIPGYDAAIEAKIEVRSVCRNDICHCAFVEISDEDVEKIHQYMLEKQKALLRFKRLQRSNLQHSIAP